MKKRLSCWLLGVLLVAILFWAGYVSAAAAAVAAPVTLKVYNPNGAFEVTQTFAPRLATLHDKTICEVSDVTWEANRTFALIADLLQKQFPTVKFVSWDQFPTGVFGIDSDKIGELVKAKGCQAAIVGNAG